MGLIVPLTFSFLNKNRFNYHKSLMILNSLAFPVVCCKNTILRVQSLPKPAARPRDEGIISQTGSIGTGKINDTSL